MTITATFSNGFTDTYKGDRDVRAAWAIFKDGKVLASGHSLDRVRAQKTAEGSVAQVVSIGRYTVTCPRSTLYVNPAWAAHAKQALVTEGNPFTGKGASALLRHIKAHNADINAAKRALVTIEVVDL